MSIKPTETARLPLVSPGEVLREEFMKPLGLSVSRVAQATGTDPVEIRAILRGRRGITPEMALALGAAFRTTARFWVNLQSQYSFAKIERERAGEAR